MAQSRDALYQAIGKLNPSETVASRGMVTATTGSAAVEAGLDMLRQGGSAADAVAATALTQACLAAGSWVSYAGIYTMVYFDAATSRTYNLNAAFNTVKDERDPGTIPGIKMSDVGAGGFNAFTYEPSGRTALTPGFMAGIEATHRRFGKLPLTTVFAPAIRCAEEGFEWSAGHAHQYAFRAAVLSRRPETRSVFLKPDGQPYAPGETFRQPLLARTLHRAATEGIGNYLYRGEWAQKLVAAVRSEGGKMTLADLEDYAATWNEPTRASYHGYDIYSHGLPAAGGVFLTEALHLAEIAELSKQGRYSQSPQALYWLAQIVKPAFILGPAAMVTTPELEAAIRALDLDLSLASRLEPGTARKLWEAIRSGRLPGVAQAPASAPAHSDSVVAIDQWGNMAAVVHSINTVSWGASGIFVDGISIPDSAAFQQPAIAAAGRGVRLPDPTNPGLVVKDGKPVMAFGSIGSGLHIRTVGSLMAVLDFGLTPQQAINEPSIGCFQFGGVDKLTVGSKEFAPEFLQALRALGQDVVENDPLRGYWIGIQIDPATRQLHGGAIRELAMGGRAVGY
jgi:gamma-glutamyltranspeptidase / glutathione hydrolase